MQPTDFIEPQKTIWSDKYSSLTRQKTRFGSFVRLDFPDGRPLRGAGVLAFDGTNILLVQLYRPAINAKVWELPAGGVEDGESARDAAVRELYEETGVRVDSGSLVSLGDVVGLAARSSNVGTYFFAVVPAGAACAPRDDEISMSAWVPLDVAVNAIMTGSVNDGYTVASVLRAMHRGLFVRA